MSPTTMTTTTTFTSWTMLLSLVVLLLLTIQSQNDVIVVVNAQEEGTATTSTFVDDIWHCNDPTGGGGNGPSRRKKEEEPVELKQQQEATATSNFVISNAYFDLECDSTTFQWNVEKMTNDYGDLDVNPDTSELCTEIVRVIGESIDAGLPPDTINQLVNELVTDGLEPCVLWEMLFGQLAALVDILPDSTSSTSTSTSNFGDSLAIDFSPIELYLVWDDTLALAPSLDDGSLNNEDRIAVSATTGKEPFSIDRTELHGITGGHMVEALQAELGKDLIANLDLSLQTGLPTAVDSTLLLLPVTLTGQVLFHDASLAVGTDALTRIIKEEVFSKASAVDLYLFRLKIAEDVILTKISTVLVGEENANQYLQTKQQQTQQSNGGDSDDDDGFLTIALIIVISAVGAALVAVVVFIYCLVFRDSNNRNKAPLDELVVEDGDENDDDSAGLITGKSTGKSSSRQKQSSSRRSRQGASFMRSSRRSRRNRLSGDDVDGEIPAVGTSETVPDIEEGIPSDEYYQELETDGGDTSVGASNIDDGVSEMDMDTLPPPIPETDDDATMDGMESVDYTNDLVENEQYDYDTDTYNRDEVSLDGTMYSYNQDDYSLVAPPSVAPTTFTKETSQSVPMEQAIAAGVAAATLKDSNSATSTKSESSSKGLNETSGAGNAKKKGLLWSVMDGLKSVGDDSSSQKDDHYDQYGNDSNAYHGASILGPTDNDSAGNSHDSNSLLYLNQAKETGAVPLILRCDNNDTETITTIGETPIHSFYGSGKYSDKKKKQFEQLWKDEDEAEQAAAVEAHLAATAASASSKETESNILATPTKDNEVISDDAPATTKRHNTMAAASARNEAKATEYDGKTEESESVVPASGMSSCDTYIDASPASNDDAGSHNLDPSANDALPNVDEATVESQEGPTEANDVNSTEVEEGGSSEKDPETEASQLEDTSQELSNPVEMTRAPTLVDRVPSQDADDDDVEDYGSNRLPLPKTLEATFKESKSVTSDANDNISVGSSQSGSSSTSGARKGESVRKKRSSKWGSNSSVTSTDSAKFRALLGQSDTNDAALVFGTQPEGRPEKPEREADVIKVADSEATSSTKIVQSTDQLKSLLTTADSKDSAENEFENDEDFLLAVEKETAASIGVVNGEATLASTLKVRNGTAVGILDTSADDDSGSDHDITSAEIFRKPADVEEEKKEDFTDGEEDDGRNDDEDRKTSYIPAAILPATSFESKSSAEGTVTSVMTSLSAAPSVDETVTSKMGWF